MTLVAHLHADGGAAATDDAQFFRSAAFLAAEAATHSLVVEHPEGRLALPLRVREIAGGGHDAVSPYGFPGGTLEGAPLEPGSIDFTGTGLVTIFVRDRVARPVLRHGTRRNRLLIHDGARPRAVREAFRYQVRRNARRGHVVEVVHGPEVGEDALRSFAACYEETMRHAGADAGYFFDLGYLRSCVTSPRAWLVSTRGPDGGVVASAVVVISDGTLHYFLGGTRDSARRSSPSKNGFVGMLDLADGWELPLNLGGGLSAGDGLEHFKEGFSNHDDHLVTHEVVCDPRRYAELTATVRGGTGFFPAYRG